MIWATVSFRSCLWWLYRASPSLAAKNIINLISMSAIWWCPCVESSLVLLEEGVCYDQCILLANSVSLWSVSFCTPRSNLPVITGISWFPTFTFQSYMMKRTSFGVLVLEGLVGLHRTVQLQLLQHYWLGHHLDYCDIEWFALEMNRDHSVIFEIAPKYCILDSFVDYQGYSISSKGILPTVVDIMVIWIKFTHSSPF